MDGNMARHRTGDEERVLAAVGVSAEAHLAKKQSTSATREDDNVGHIDRAVR